MLFNVFAVDQDDEDILKIHPGKHGHQEISVQWINKVIDVFSAFKHVETDIVGSSSGSPFLKSGNKITLTKLMLFVRSTSGGQYCVALHACIY